MRLYSGSSQQFIEDSVRSVIGDKLREAFFRHFRHNPSESEANSWRNSLAAMSNVLQFGGLVQQGIILEYQLPLSSLRLDCMITGMSNHNEPHAVIVELKQWSTTEPSNIDDCVTTFVGGRLRDVLHPSRQVGQYQQYLEDCHDAFSTSEVGLDSCAYLHNMQFDPEDELFSPKHASILDRYPIFTGTQAPKLAEFLSETVGNGDGLPILNTVLESGYRPSKKLLDHTSEMVKGQTQYVLLDEQLVAFNSVLSRAKESFHDKKKSVLLVKGGPGTGKSVLALNLIGDLAEAGYNVQHATGSRAFTENVRKIVGRRASAQFKYFNSFMDADTDAIDVLVSDEAHRIRETSNSRFTPRAKRSGMPQVDELVRAAKVSVFFIDDLQVVRPGEIGNSDLIIEAAKRHDTNLYEYELEAQFRCNGSDAFINWVDNTLQIRRTANVLWDASDEFDFRVVDSVQGLEQLIRTKDSEGYSARLAAGFCWDWSGPTSEGELVDDVQIGEWKMPWNAKPNAGKLAAGIEQVGCVYTAQGFEFDYCGLIFGPDLKFDLSSSAWVGDPSQSADSVVKRSKSGFLELVKNTYRVLLTRGMKGCYVYFSDPSTRDFFRSRIE
jgi:DUF2075 family protein